MIKNFNIQKLENKVVLLIYNILVLGIVYIFSSIAKIEKEIIIVSIVVYSFYVAFSILDILDYLNKYIDFSFFKERNLVIYLNLKDIKNLPNKSAIYRIINASDGKSYIGKAQNIRKRISGHFRDLANLNHVNYLLQECYNNGSVMKVEILETFEKYNPIELRILERLYIKKFKSRNVENGYNLRD